MNAVDSPPDTSRGSDALCGPEFRTPPSELPHAGPPQWMRTGLIVAAACMGITAIIVLMSPMDEYILVSGYVRPAEYAFVFARTDGILESIDVADGTDVTEGEVLAKLDRRAQVQLIETIEAEIVEAEAEVALTRAAARKIFAAPVPPEFLFSAVEVDRQQEITDIQQQYLRRLEELQRTGAASGTELLNLRMQLIASEAMLRRSRQANELFTGTYGEASREEAQAREAVAAARLTRLKTRLSQAKADLDLFDVTAPVSGTILATARRFPGEPVSAGHTLFKVTIADENSLRLYASEDRIERIEPGQLVRFRARNNPDRLAPFATARVVAVAMDRDLEVEQTDFSMDGTASYRVIAEVENQPYPLAVGATVDAEIVIARRPFWRLLFLKVRGER